MQRLPSAVRSPLRPVPRLARQRRPRVQPAILLGVPRISPVRELAVLRALMKPQLKSALKHQIDAGEQHWPADGPDRLAATVAVARERFGIAIDFHEPCEGEFFAVASVPAEARPSALAAALLLSRLLPGRWIVVGRLFVLDGRFYRRERRVKLRIRPATDVHLSRALRASLRESLRSLNGIHQP